MHIRGTLRRSVFPALAILALAPPPAAGAAACADAARQAERAHGIPGHLLAAIGTVESAGDPNAVNVDGAGHHFATSAAAIGFVRQAVLAGARFIDVGCFQIDLAYHPDAFASLDDAFDPAANARAASSFLGALHDQRGSWPDAVADYHSRDPLLGGAYRDLVLASAAGQPGPFTRRPGGVDAIMVYAPGMVAAQASSLPRVYVP